jgi:isoleucyl-tRNA synthetase
MSTLLFDQPCFKNVICLGHVVDAQGEKMSKSKGNVIDPWTVVNDYGADALRWYMLASVPGENVHRFSAQAVAKTMREFLLTLWNTYSFFTIYANIDCFIPRPSFSVALSELDNWIISELNRLIVEVTKALDNYDLTSAARLIGNFVDNLSNWYVRRSRRRFWRSEEDADKLAAYNTLYQCLVSLSKLLAPFTPFIAEELYQNLVCSVDSEAKGSVQLTDFPVPDEAKINNKLSSEVELVMKISSLGRAARARAGIKVRQPLGKAVIKVESKEEEETIGRQAAQILEEINVKQIEFSREEFRSQMFGYSVASDARHWVAISTELPPELRAEGISREIVRRLQNMRREANFNIADRIVTCYQAEEPVKQVMIDFADYIKQETLSLELTNSSPPEGAYVEKHHISGNDILLAIMRLTNPE